MLDFQEIIFEKEDGLAILTINRPPMNAMSYRTYAEFHKAADIIAADEEVKVVIITGSGDRAFSAGGDVKAFYDLGDSVENAREYVNNASSAIRKIKDLEVPVIAAVNGLAMGGGIEVMCACDFRIASEKAIFGQPEIKLGFFPPYAALRLPELVGPAKAIEIVTTGQNYSAAESMALGFVSKVAGVEDFEKTVDETVKQITKSSPLIIRLNKRAVKRHIGTSFFQGVDLVSNYFLKTLMKTEDTLEGIASFEEKRKPVWKSR